MIKRLAVVGILFLLCCVPLAFGMDQMAFVAERDRKIKTAAEDMAQEMLLRVYPDQENIRLSNFQNFMRSGWCYNSYAVYLDGGHESRMIISVNTKIEHNDLENKYDLTMELEDIKFDNNRRPFDPPGGDDAFGDMTKLGTGYWRNTAGELHRQLYDE